MPYRETNKNLDSIRKYVREFFVNGFKKDQEIAVSSSFNDNRNKVKSCLSGSVNIDDKKSEDKYKVTFFTTDSRTIRTNPFYDIFKTKEFTKRDILFRFLILDDLSDKSKKTSDITKKVFFYADTKSVPPKLDEYVKLGLITKTESKNRDVYSIVKHTKGELEEIEMLKDAVVFFSESDPLGVAGYYIKERYGDNYSDLFRFKHKYIFRTIDSEVLYYLVCAINKKVAVEIKVVNEKDKRKVYPYKIYISSQSGRQYLFYFEYESKTPAFVRIDQIKTNPSLEEIQADFDFDSYYEKIKNNFFGVSSKFCEKTEHIEFVVQIEDNEKHILDRLRSEKRCGTVEKVGENLWKFSADVYDTLELVPWIKTFIGRLVVVNCENEEVKNRISTDFDALYETYEI